MMCACQKGINQIELLPGIGIQIEQHGSEKIFYDSESGKLKAKLSEST